MATAALAEEVASNFEEAAVVTRKLSGAGVGYFGFGVVVGAAIGFYYGHKYLKEKLRAEAFEESKAEVEKIREVYSLRASTREKPGSPEDVVREQGYTVEETPKIIVAHQAHALKAEGKKDQEIMDELGVSAQTLRILLASPAPERPLKPPVPVDPATGRTQYHRVGRPPESVVLGPTRDIPWDYEAEHEKRAKLDPDQPYVIHEDEYHETMDGRPRPGWTQMAYTYYTRDDVLAGEDEQPIHDAEEVIGHYNLRFGDGSTDPDTVFIRNPERMVEVEVTKVDRSYEEHVLGLDANEEG